MMCRLLQAWRWWRQQETFGLFMLFVFVWLPWAKAVELKEPSLFNSVFILLIGVCVILKAFSELLTLLMNVIVAKFDDPSYGKEIE